MRRWEDDNEVVSEGVETREKVESLLLASAELGGDRNGSILLHNPESDVTVLVGICAEVLTVLSTSMASEAEPPVLILVPKSHSVCDDEG